MGITPKDIQDQRKLLERGERILEAQEQQAERARLRDHFASAALTGLLAKHGLHGSDFVQERAYVVADAMLRERERTNLDAAPAAKAAKESLARGTDADGTGDTPDSQTTPGQCSTPREGTSEPVAWWLRGTEYDTGCEYEYVSLLKENAEAAAAEGGTVVPLYRSPMLTPEEQDAITQAEGTLREICNATCDNAAATLRGLLERMK